MSSYIVITKDQRIPPEVINFTYDVMTSKEFLDAAYSDDGIDLGEGIFVNVDSLSQDFYNILKGVEGTKVTYYQFSDQSVPLTFLVEEGITNYQIEEPEEIEEEPVVVEEVKPEPVVEKKEEVKEELPNDPYSMIAEVNVLESGTTEIDTSKLNTSRLQNLLQFDDVETEVKKYSDPANVILFGSSKGGTGKTFTCLLSAYRYAKTHPTERVALADFDIIDGQIGITINKNSPTMADYYKQYVAGNSGFKYLSNIIVKNDHFSPNLDFYLAPPMDVPQITNNTDFWTDVFQLLVTNYDTVFFDSGIDYLGKEPISRLYKYADKIILTSNTSINSVKSIIRQLQTLSGNRKNNVFSAEHKILDKVNLVLTRVSAGSATNDLVIENLTKWAPIVAAFGNIDDQISQSQWYQRWEIWDYETKINHYLDVITAFSD